MHKFIFFLLFQFFIKDVFSSQSNVQSENVFESNLHSNRILEPWDTPEGILRIQNSNAKANFWQLVRFYESQIRSTYCSIATCVIALNALSVEAPKSSFFGHYRIFTQEEFFSEDVSAVMSREEVVQRGMTLEELAAILKLFPLEVFRYDAQHLSQEEIRHILISALLNQNQCVIALYHRRELKQVGGGHWSPIAAYDHESDSFLVLDVAKFKYPPTWINASAFISAMQTENIYGKSRGFIIIEKK